MVRINPDKYLERTERVFRASVLAFRQESEVSDELSGLMEEARQYFKARDFLESSSYFGALLISTLDYLKHAKDRHGMMGDFVYEAIDHYKASVKMLVKNSQGVDLEHMFRFNVLLYLDEELGYAGEVMKLTLECVDNATFQVLDNTINTLLVDRENLGTYRTGKLIELLIKLYERFKQIDKYIEACRMLPDDRWEYYVYPAQMLESLNRIDEAKRIYEEGLAARTNNRAAIEKYYNEFKRKVMGF